MIDIPTKVVIAMSGGVDSSVAAALLQQQGYAVTGVMLRLWSEPGKEDCNRCCAPEAMAMARRVAGRLGIPFYVLDARETFYEQVVKDMLHSYASGVTPNPCLTCNRLVRWDFLYQYALSLGAGYLATGHYARVERNENGALRLLRALDRNKDQSYVLHMLTQEKLAHTLFPLGELTKPQVRQIARELELPVAERPDSQDLCFLGEGDLDGFLLRHAPELAHPGEIRNRQGEVLGRHRGLAFYTIGQRKGLGLSALQPYYVFRKDVAQNQLIVGTASELGQEECHAQQVNWLAGAPPASAFRAQVKIRYKAQEARATVTPEGNQEARVRFDQPLRDITPGQAVVFYSGEEVLGGGVIRSQ